MYEHDAQTLAAALYTLATDRAVRAWTVSNTNALVIQAIALMHQAGVPLPPGTLETLVTIRIPASQVSGVDTVFHAWSNQEAQRRLTAGAQPNLGEIRLGDNVQPVSIGQDCPGSTDHQIRIVQLRGLIHELFHTLDFGDVVRDTNGDRDAAIRRQYQLVGFGQSLPGYARNEIVTDFRAGLVLERARLMFPGLRRSLDEYQAYWQAQCPLSDQAFAAVLATLNRKSYP
jgi:hypothetical protein